MAKKVCEYVQKVDSMNEAVKEFVRGELAWLGEWISERSQLNNYGEIRKFLHETLDVSV